MSAKFVVRDLRKRYGRIEAVQGLSFAVDDGEIFGLLGPNGAGKTTTVECLLGLREPDGGQIELCGIDARRHPRETKQRIGAALQTTSLQDKITPREALVLFGSFYARHADPDPLLARFSLADKADVPFDTLSGGQRQRLALALAFVNTPDLVFLDEPTTGLDPTARRDLHDDILRMKQSGQTVLLTTHDMDEAATLCDRIAIIDHGRIVASGAPRELTARSQQRQLVTIVTTGPLDRGWLAEMPAVEDLVVDGGHASFHTPALSKALAAVAAAIESKGIELAELHVQRASLEDVFIELTRPGADR
jgi:ABC-2 type transport system ATP-binding protein